MSDERVGKRFKLMMGANEVRGHSVMSSRDKRPDKIAEEFVRHWPSTSAPARSTT